LQKVQKHNIINTYLWGVFMEKEITVVDSVNNEIVRIKYRLKSNNEWKLLNITRTGNFADKKNGI